jgi:hypothetical protein
MDKPFELGRAARKFKAHASQRWQRDQEDFR